MPLEQSQKLFLLAVVVVVVGLRPAVREQAAAAAEHLLFHI